MGRPHQSLMTKLYSGINVIPIVFMLQRVLFAIEILVNMGAHASLTESTDAVARQIILELDANVSVIAVERRGSGVELRTLDYENPSSNTGCGVKTLGKLYHSTLLQFTQLNK